MKLSIYLFSESVKDFGETLLDKCTGVGADIPYVEVNPNTKLPFACRAYVQRSRSTVPSWLNYLQEYFDVKGLGIRNVSSSFILLLRVEDRVFAVTFGHGFQALDHSKIEPRFGLRTALNALDARAIRALDTRNVDLVTRQKRVDVNVGSPLAEFDIDVDLDWVRYVSGRPHADHIGTNVSGSEALKLGCDTPLESLSSKCCELLELFRSDRYRASFSFIDYLQPLSAVDQRRQPLNACMVDLLKTRAYDRISIAYPEPVDYDRLLRFKIWQGRARQHSEDVTLAECYRFFDGQPGSEPDPSRTFIVGLDADDNAVLRKRPLHEYLVCEIDYRGSTYLLSLGQWFEADRSYIDSVERQIDRIRDVTSEVRLPAIRLGESEGDYNRRVASDKGWAVLDKSVFRVAQTFDKIEVCDLLSEEGYFTCVKKMQSSATLSHLFAQGSVSATLLADYAEYRDAALRLARQKWPEWDLPSNPVFVYAIPTEKGGPLSRALFFFSKVNLLAHRRTIERLGYEVALCKVAYLSSAMP